MRAMVIEGSFGLKNLQLTEREKPKPGPGEVLLRMKAASLNYRDLLTVQGPYNPKQALPLVPCSDGVGDIVELGEGVTEFELGDRVATLFAQRWQSGRIRREVTNSTLGGPLDGTLQDYMVLPSEGVVKVPRYLTDAEASCLPCAAVTAWSALCVQGNVKAGETVLTLGTGGVSLFALQIAKALGARVIVTSSSDSKLERARKLGAWRGLNYKKNPRWGKTVADMTDGRGVDHVVEVGGSKTLGESLTAVRAGGQISLIGVLSGLISDLNIIPIIMRGIRVQGILVGDREGFEDMNRAFELHEIVPTVDRIFRLEETPEALQYMMEGKHFGKIVIAIND